MNIASNKHLEKSTSLFAKSLVRVGSLAILFLASFALLFIAEEAKALPVAVFDDLGQFTAATSATQVPIPSANSLPSFPCSGFGGVGCGGGPSITIPFDTNSVKVTVLGHGNLTIFDAGAAVPLSNTNPNPISPTIFDFGEDDTLLVFATPVGAIGIQILTNFSAEETVTLKDADGNVIATTSIGALTSPNSFEFVGFSSATPIKSLLLDSTSGGPQNEGIFGIWVGPSATVPEPSTLALLGTGLLGMLLLGRQQSKGTA